MRILLVIALSCVLGGGAEAQRRGGGMGGGGIRGGGMGGGAFRGGGMGGGAFRGGAGGFNRGFSGGFNGGFNRGFGGGFNRGFGGFNRGFGGGFNRGFGGFGRFHNRTAIFNLGFGFGYGGFGWGWGWPYDFAYASYPYIGGYWPGYSDVYPYNYTAGYGSSPGVTVVYPPQQQTPVYVERANPVVREYDRYGQEIKPETGTASNEAPLYLIALQDHTIQAAVAYWVDGRTLHYVTLQREHKQAPLDTVDRELTLRLNRERRVPIQLP